VNPSYTFLAISLWLNELARNPYIRSDPSFIAFVTDEGYDCGKEPQLDSLRLHNPEVKVNLADTM